MLLQKTRAEILAEPTLYTISDLAPIITKFLNVYLGHLNLANSTLEVPSITLDVIQSKKTLEGVLPYCSNYDYHTLWEVGILKYEGIPNLLLFNNESYLGPLLLLIGDINITKTILYTLSQQMEIVKDGFAYKMFDSVLNYRNDPSNLTVLD